MTFAHTFLSAIVGICYTFIGSQGFADAVSASRALQAQLGLEEAQARSQRVSEIKYQLHFDLTAAKTFTGSETIAFALSDAKADLNLDFTGGEIANLRINDQDLGAVTHNGFYVTLKKEWLKVGQNVVKISYQHAYSTTGNGFYRFEDPLDKRVYLFTDFEPFRANQLFPCFDQPDLKATYKLTVKVPDQWQVISSTRETKIVKNKDSTAQWSFPETAKFSTYVFSLHAGEYHVWEDQAGRIKLRLFARQSMAKYVDYRDWFKITKQGLQFYQAYFDYAYPFKKYDQLVVPDFNWGAMENVAAVTFTEKYAPKGEPTEEDKEDRAETILHEMAHMFFGNLVTMRWWDDLWLNESFATYLSYLALVESTRFKTAWESFYANTKQWAYWEDQMSTTHGITNNAQNTEDAFASFDGITYGKGASTLKQLDYYLGGHKFREGVRQYIKQNAYDNATLADFMAALSKAGSSDLQEFQTSWLEEKGLNSIEPVYTCEKGLIADFKILQSAPKHAPTLRTHKTQIGLYHRNPKGKVSKFASVDVVYAGAETTVPGLVGKVCPLLVNANVSDFDYVKVKLDHNSLVAAKASLGSLSEPLDRMMLWRSLWDMTRDGELDVYSYNSIVYELATREKEFRLLSQITESVTGSRSRPGLLHYLPELGKESEKLRTEIRENWEDLAWRMLQGAKPGTDPQKLWFDVYTSLAHSSKATARLQLILDNKLSFRKFPIDQDRRWQIIARLSSLAYPSSDKLLNAEGSKDKSASGKKFMLSVQAIRPNVETKKVWLQKVIDEKSELSLAEKRSVIRNLFPNEQSTLRAKFEDSLYNIFPSLVGKHDEELLETIAEYLSPVYCSPTSVRNLEKYIARNQNLPPYMLKQLKINKEEDERCLNIRNVAIKAVADKNG